MDKGKLTKQNILEAALDYASDNGLELLTIGKLAEIAGMSKSGLFAHFNSKEKLQIEVLKYASEKYTKFHFVPALKKPRGIPRITAIFDLWLKRTRHNGCIFVAASAEFDDTPGRVRDLIYEIQAEWIESLAKAGKLAIECGDFRKNSDTQQFAFELFSILLGYHHFSRMLGDKKATVKTWKAFDDLLKKYSFRGVKK